MLPYRDEPVPAAQSIPFVTVTLILINIAVFLYQITLGQEGAEEFVTTYGFVPTEFWAGNQIIGLVTAMFLHGSIVHIASNMLFLGIFGNNVEDQLGHGTYLIVYLAAGMVASLGFGAIFADQTAPLIGASGAVAAVLGGYILLFPRAMVRSLLFFGPFITAGRVAAILLIGFWFLVQVFQSTISFFEIAEQSNVAFLAHVLGFIVGLIATGVIRENRDQKITHWGEGEQWWNRAFRNWFLLAMFTVLAGVAIQAFAARESEEIAALIQLAFIIVIGIVALVDGIVRLRGKQGLLGSTQKMERTVAIVQIVAAIGVFGSIFIL